MKQQKWKSTRIFVRSAETNLHLWVYTINNKQEKTGLWTPERYYLGYNGKKNCSDIHSSLQHKRKSKVMRKKDSFIGEFFF